MESKMAHNKTLGDYLEEYSERNLENNYKPVAVGKYGIRKREDIYSKELAKDYSKNKLIYKDTLTVGMGSKQIDIGILLENAIYSVSPAYHTFRIKGINSEYLKYYLSHRNKDMSNRFMIESARQGKSVDFKRMMKYTVKEHTENEQYKIVDKIKRIENGISKLENIMEELDKLNKAHFYELFGDPVSNEKGWEAKPLEKVCEAIVDCPHSTPSYTDENTGYMCIRTSIIKRNKILWDEIEYISEEEYKSRIKRKKPQKGDIVYSREGGILGIAAIIDKEYDVALGQRLMLLTPDNNVCNSEFLCTAMNFDTFLNRALGKMGGSAAPHINVGDIRAFEMIIPPIELQRDFSSYVRKIENAKEHIGVFLDEMIKLQNSCMIQNFD